MALPTAHTKADDLITELALTQEQFDWEGRTGNATLAQRVANAIRKARIAVIQRVGTSNYSSTDDIVLEVVQIAEFDLACADLMMQRAHILIAAPQDSPPREEVDPDLLVEMARARETNALASLAPYATSEDMDKPGTGFAWGATGIDETEADYSTGAYDAQDFDELPS